MRVLTVLEFWTIFSRMQDREQVFHWKKRQFYFKSWETEIISPPKEIKVKPAYCPLSMIQVPLLYFNTLCLQVSLGPFRITLWDSRARKDMNKKMLLHWQLLSLRIQEVHCLLPVSPTTAFHQHPWNWPANLLACKRGKSHIVFNSNQREENYRTHSVLRSFDSLTISQTSTVYFIYWRLWKKILQITRGAQTGLVTDGWNTQWYHVTWILQDAVWPIIYLLFSWMVGDSITYCPFPMISFSSTSIEVTFVLQLNVCACMHIRVPKLCDP